MESLTIRRELGDKWGIAECLEVLASVYGKQSQLEQAAWLFGAAEALREAINCPLPTSERLRYDSAVTAIRAALSEEAFTAAWAEGRAMAWEQAVAYALESTG